MESRFDGTLLGYIGHGLLAGILMIITLGIGTPWAICMMKRWEISHKIIDGKRMCFDGTGGQLFGSFIKWCLLSLITFGIYSLWIPIKLLNWQTAHTHVGGDA